MNKLKGISRLVQILLLALACIGPLTLIYAWSMASNTQLLLQLRILPTTVMHVGILNSPHWVSALLVSLIPTLFAVAILCLFAALFGQFAQGRVFSARGMRCFKWAGGLTLFWELIHPLYDMLITYVVLPQQHHLWTAVQFDLSNVRGVIVGIILYAMAWVLSEARRLQDEQDLTI